MKKYIELFTDGACSGNPGPGGWGVVLRYGQHEKELSGGEKETTNNRMELTAAIKGLEALKNNWIKSDKKPALNSDLWERLLELLEKHEVKIEWVKGHAGHAENERCDRLAVEYYKNMKEM